VKENDYLKYGGIVLLVVLGVLFLVPGLISNIGALFSGEISSCDIAPYSSNCFCEEGQRKISVPWLGVPRWSCETLEDLLLDPESPTFEDDAISFSEEYLSRNCGEIFTDACHGVICGCPEENPNCGSFASSHPIYPTKACIAPVWGWGSQGARLVNVECLEMKTWNTPSGELSHEDAIALYGNNPNGSITPASGTAPWRMNFFVESKTDIPTTLEVLAHTNYCYNETLNKKCTYKGFCDSLDNPEWCVGKLPLNIVPNDYPMSIVGIGVPQLGSGYPAPR